MGNEHSFDRSFVRSFVRSFIHLLLSQGAFTGSKLPGVGGPAIELEASGNIEIRKYCLTV